MQLLLLLLCLFGITIANTEIRHVVGPSNSSISLKALTALRSKVSTLPNTAFIQHYANFDVDNPQRGKVLTSHSNANSRSNSEQWYIIDTVPSKRYEIRISYPAINPTNFEIDTFEASSMLQEWGIKDTSSDRVDTSVLFVRIRAVAMGISIFPQANVGYNIVVEEMVFNLFPPVIFPLIGSILVLVFLSWFVLFPFFERYILSVLMDAYADDIKTSSVCMDIWGQREKTD